ncbi:hypothetical protein OF83DRAFT_1174062 [Amylostereum chailletii]|nr:hypothetical protein OF83DRAFT_1174062 [Amylostereum chailletii]
MPVNVSGMQATSTMLVHSTLYEDHVDSWSAEFLPEWDYRRLSQVTEDPLNYKRLEAALKNLTKVPDRAAAAPNHALRRIGSSAARSVFPPSYLCSISLLCVERGFTQMQDESDDEDKDEAPTVLIDNNHPRVVEEDKVLVIPEDVELPDTQPPSGPKYPPGVSSPCPRQPSGSHTAPLPAHPAAPTAIPDAPP